MMKRRKKNADISHDSTPAEFEPHHQTHQNHTTNTSCNNKALDSTIDDDAANAGAEPGEAIILPLMGGNGSEQLDQSTLHLSQSFLDTSMNMNIMNTYQQHPEEQPS